VSWRCSFPIGKARYAIKEKSAKFVELDVMGHWRRRLGDRRGACLSM
jgi:hypothetical protein